MTFLVQYPAFILTRDDCLLIEDRLQPPDSSEVIPKAVPVFTDVYAAEDYRDRYHPKCQVDPIPNELFLARILTEAKDLIFFVVFDPYRLNYRVRLFPITELLAQLPEV